MANPQVNIDIIPRGRNGRAIVTATCDDESIYSDRIDLLKHQHREKFLSKLIERYPEISLEDVRNVLERAASDAIKKLFQDPQSDSSANTPNYRATPEGIVWDRVLTDGPVPTLLTNFTAHIISETIRDDGVETERFFTIEAEFGGQKKTFDVPVARFNTLNWVSEELGAKALVYAGFGIKDNTRVAIQLLSGEVKIRHIYTHTGWRKIKNKHVFIHAGGSIGPKGPIIEIEVQLPEKLISVNFPPPPKTRKRKESILAALELLDLGPEHILFPLLASVFLAVLGETDLSLHISGGTGVFKTEVAAIFQSFFGEEFHSRNLIESWLSTSNSLERLASHAKDILVVIDDFAPQGSVHDIRRYHKNADHVLRAQGNKSGRGRCRSDGTLISGRKPRCLPLSTGEDTPKGHSLRARMLILEISDGDISAEKLTEFQGEAQKGIYALAMSGFIRWIAERYDDLQKLRKKRIPELRTKAARTGQHRRTASIIAQLYFGFETFIEYALHSKVITHKKSKQLKLQCWSSLQSAAKRQTQLHADSDPVKTYIRHIKSALASGAAFIADSDGQAPERYHPESLGWRKDTYDDWRPQGVQIGWIDDDGLYLNSEASFKVAQTTAADGEQIPVQSQTLLRRIKERGFLVTYEPERNTIRKRLQGSRQKVLHFKISTFSKSGQSGHSGPESDTAKSSRNQPARRKVKKKDSTHTKGKSPTSKKRKRTVKKKKRSRKKK